MAHLCCFNAVIRTEIPPTAVRKGLLRHRRKDRLRPVRRDLALQRRGEAEPNTVVAPNVLGDRLWVKNRNAVIENP